MSMHAYHYIILFRQIEFFHIHHFKKNRHYLEIILYDLLYNRKILQDYICNLRANTQIVLF